MFSTVINWNVLVQVFDTHKPAKIKREWDTLATEAMPFLHFFTQIALHTAPVSSNSGRKRIAPDTHMVQAVDRPLPIFALAEFLPQKNVGAASCPMCRHITYGCRSSGTNPKLDFVHFWAH